MNHVEVELSVSCSCGAYEDITVTVDASVLPMLRPDSKVRAQGRVRECQNCRKVLTAAR